MKIIVMLLCLLSFSLLRAMDKADNVLKKIPVLSWVYSCGGKRDYYEDRCAGKSIEYKDNKYTYTAIFDGHSGYKVAELAENNFFNFFENKLKEDASPLESLKYACQECERLTQTKELEFMGSTVLASCFNHSSGELSLLWLGDSQAFVDDFFVTRAHVATDNDEQERILKSGGWVTGGKLNGIIEVSRSLGDAAWKKKIPLSSESETEVHNVFYDYGDGAKKLSGYFIGASDGFWDVMDDESDIIQCLEDAKKLSRADFYEKYNSEDYSDYSDDMSSEDENDINPAKRLAYIAIRDRGSRDNTSVILQIFGEPGFLKDNNEDDNEENFGMLMSGDVENSLTCLQNFSSDSEDEKPEIVPKNDSNVEEIGLLEKNLVKETELIMVPKKAYTPQPFSDPDFLKDSSDVGSEESLAMIINEGVENFLTPLQNFSSDSEDEKPEIVPKNDSNVEEIGLLEKNLVKETELIMVPKKAYTPQIFGDPGFLKDSSGVGSEESLAMIINEDVENFLTSLQNFSLDNDDEKPQLVPKDDSNVEEIVLLEKKLVKETELIIVPKESFLEKYRYVIGGGIIALCTVMMALYKYKYSSLYCLPV